MNTISLAAISAIAGCLLLSGPAGAGDQAERVVFGFSPDGRYFAFEQFGRLDGSGFPYADIFVVDTGDDSWVPGTPVTVRIDNELADVKWARREAMTKAGNLLKKLVIAQPGRILASNPPSELSADPHQVVVNASVAVPPVEEAWTFSLSEHPLSAKHCEGIADTKGFRLVAGKKGGAPAVWHADKSLPESRGCPLRYAISDVIVHDGADTSRVFAILISVFSFGFEGPDRRFLAVTGRAR